ncbi:MAG: arylsulfotransferase family protein [Solirubrobacteraceae bacterium]
MPATAGGSVSGGVQRFLSRPDLLAPEVVIDTPAQPGLAGVVVTESHLGSAQSGALIVDQTGRIVWFNPVASDPSSPLRAFNVSVQQYRGQPVLCWFEGTVAGRYGVGYGQGHYQIVDTNYEQVAQVSGHQGLPGDLHEFFLTPEGTAIFTCYGQSTGRIRIGSSMRTVPYYYGVVQEVDVATGKLRWFWRTDRHVPLSYSYARPTLPKPGYVWDYFHINGVCLDPRDGNVIVSSRNTSTVYKVNRRTGQLMWRLGGKHSDFHMGPGTRFNYQHDANLHPGGVMTVFDNGGGPPRFAAHSRALVLSVDEKRRRVRLVHAFHHQPPVYSDALGSVQPLGAGRWFVGWGRGAAFSAYSNSGEVLFDGHLDPAASSYRAFLQPWTGTPIAPPDIAVSRSGTAATVYASWNGSSEVAQWMVLGGASPSSLSPLGIAPIAGFETAVNVASAPSHLAAAACTASGQVLATSAAVAGPVAPSRAR